MISQFPGFGPHEAYVLASYLICFVVMLGLIIGIRLDGARQRKILDDLEARGITTRRTGNKPALKDAR